MKDFKYDLCVVGGAGHIGLPFALVFADKGLNVAIYDISLSALEKSERDCSIYGRRGRAIAEEGLGIWKTNPLQRTRNCFSVKKYCYYDWYARG
ncbi:MAG: hypothetical protein IPP54_05535 [Anaerolineales bacterium]|nr:hypothetical protein [Anaerolineales bacterium]